MLIFFDTETSGLWNFKAEPDDDSQPHMVQLAFIVDDLKGNTLQEYNYYIKLPEDIVMEPGAVKAHGITRTTLDAHGISLASAVSAFNKACHKSTDLIAHNIDFDLNVMRAAYIRSYSMEKSEAQYFEDLDKFCTMKEGTDVCKLPGRGRNYKWPTLNEAYRILINIEGFEGAHDALNDVRACRDVYYELKKRKGK